MTTRRARRTARTAALAAVTAALALGLTACGGSDGGSKAAGGDRAADTAQSLSASGANGKGGAEQADSSGDNSSGDNSGVGTKESVSRKTVSRTTTAAAARQCNGDEMLVTAVHRFAGEQGDHLLITASNENTTACWVTSYPSVKLGGDVDVAALPHSTKDNPGGTKHITLQPGAKVYSAVNLFDYGSKNRTADSFAIALRDASGHAGPYYSVDIQGQKTDFTWYEADVLNWNTEKSYDF
ncbi:DUF4232 domain-containing protein [Streptomyces sp. SID13726]|uniref:DUF4232 domain-containing protein n=1 Tax=Streptomyces sp. SID13726 TaxID=2706058 RepID=UPI0013B6D431|nr:DUF4232 domain-containing protein [Streptomyces sp. SID13726]NEB03866.1 DUF4232 domain-containing protein [Streptomyces sp. SID13726]